MIRTLSYTSLVLGVLTTLGCMGLSVEEPPSRFDEVAAQVEEAAPKPIGAIVAGSAFNALFPESGYAGHSRTFTQEKEGYAEAEYSLGDDTVVVSISDTRDHPSARDKFTTATEHAGAHPVVARGKNSSLALVAGRFQVRVSSTSKPHAERVAWLSAVNLDQLAALH